MGVEREMGRFLGFPMRRRKYRGGSSHDRAGRGMSSVETRGQAGMSYLSSELSVLDVLNIGLEL